MPSDDKSGVDQSQALAAAGEDANTTAGANHVDDPVAPCNAGEPKGPLWVRLDLTQEQAAKDPGGLRLQGSGYDATLPIAANFKANATPDNTVDLVFDGVPVKGTYTLSYVRDDQQTALVEGAPYSSLQDDALPAANEGDSDPTPEKV